MTEAVARYRALRARLLATRDEKGDDSPEVEQILEDMDDMWWEMYEDEKELFRTNDPAGDRQSALEAMGFVCGPRDSWTLVAQEAPKGAFIVAKGLWFIVGDDLAALINEAYVEWYGTGKALP